MEISEELKSTSQHPVVSPEAAFVANLSGARLHIRSIPTLDIVRSVSVNAENDRKTSLIRWAPAKQNGGQCTRVLFSDEEDVRVWDLTDEQWCAHINNGSGGMGKIVNAEFGHTDDEVLTFSDFGAKVTIWSLTSGRSVEIKDPKFSNRGVEYRPLTGNLTVLSRSGAQDMVTIHAPSTYYVLKTIVLSSLDAQNLKWSPNGHWLAVWDAPSSGYKLFIYTADGHLYRMYSGDSHDGIDGLGVRSVEWSPAGTVIAVGGHDKRVTLLSTRTFSPVVFLDHTDVVQLSNGRLWQEQVSASTKRNYSLMTLSFNPPTVSTTPADSTLKIGISLLAFNHEGNLLATKDDSTPTTVWLWDLQNLGPHSILTQHAPVKHLMWHPSAPNLLLIQCSQDEPIVYLWNTDNGPPGILQIPLSQGRGKYEARWLKTAPESSIAFIFSNLTRSILVWPYGGREVYDPVSKSKKDEADDTDDSLMNILSGRTAVPTQELDTTLGDILHGTDSDTTIADTFAGRKPFGIL